MRYLIELHLGDGQQGGIDLFSLLGGSPQPLQDGFFRHAQDKANVRERRLSLTQCINCVARTLTVYVTCIIGRNRLGRFWHRSGHGCPVCFLSDSVVRY